MEQSGRPLERSGIQPGEAERRGKHLVTEEEAGRRSPVRVGDGEKPTQWA